jgi:hypothetical protein
LSRLIRRPVEVQVLSLGAQSRYEELWLLSATFWFFAE